MKWNKVKYKKKVSSNSNNSILASLTLNKDKKILIKQIMSSIKYIQVQAEVNFH